MVFEVVYKKEKLGSTYPMSEIVSHSIKKIATGTLLVAIGTLFNLLFGLICRITFVKYTSITQYGIFSLVLTIIAIFTTVSTLGLNQGSTRYIAYFIGKNEKLNIQDTIFSSIILGSIASFSLMAISCVSSDVIAIRIYNTPEIAPVLKIVSITIPFIVLTNISVAVFRGFDKVNINIYFNYILKNIAYFSLLIIVIMLKFSFIEMVYSYAISVILTGTVAIIYLIKNPPFKIKWHEIRVNHITKKLLLNSIPLLTVNILLLIMSWTDTLMLGYFKTPDLVAAYNAAYPIAHILSIIVSSIAFLYVPIASKLYSQNQIKELGEINAISTKWCFMATLPIFSIMFIFPENILNLLFGSPYLIASHTLQILAIGCILDSYFGFNYYTLLSAGKSNILLKCSLVSAIFNIILNIILIPKLGIVGAAIASVLSFALIEVYMTIKLYKLLKIHPFEKSYLKITVISVILITIFYINGNNRFDASIWIILAYLAAFLVSYILSLLFTNSLNKQDITMLQEFAKKVERKFRYTSIHSDIQ